MSPASEATPPPAPGARRHAPATVRNRQPIADVLGRLLAPGTRVLEVASGTGEHAVWLTGALPGLTWQPSDPDAQMRASIASHAAAAGAAAVLPPVDLDCSRLPWPPLEADAVVCVNMTHIAPWDATLGLLQGAGRLLDSGQVLYIYGPFKRAGRHTAPSNAAFDAALRRQDPAWGVRDLDAIAAEAAAFDLDLEEAVDMPSNNLSAIFRKR